MATESNTSGIQLKINQIIGMISILIGTKKKAKKAAVVVMVTQ